jgi:uncharacterized protein YbaA (DUF1428 family)
LPRAARDPDPLVDRRVLHHFTRVTPARAKAMQAVMAEPHTQMPFERRRMIFGGFEACSKTKEL